MTAKKSPQDEGPEGALDPAFPMEAPESTEASASVGPAAEPLAAQAPPALEATTPAAAADPPVIETPAAPAPAMRADQIDAAIFAGADPDAFDENGIYVVLESAIALPYGPKGEWREPAFHGDLIAAQPQEGVRALACVELRSPADQNRIGQEASDGYAHLRELWEKGKISHPHHPKAAEARKNRVAFDKVLAQHGSDRLGDPRLNIIAAGGRVADYAYGERVQ